MYKAKVSTYSVAVNDIRIFIKTKSSVRCWALFSNDALVIKQYSVYPFQTPGSCLLSVDRLASHLCSVATSNLEKIRAFYFWVCNNIRYVLARSLVYLEYFGAPQNFGSPPTLWFTSELLFEHGVLTAHLTFGLPLTLYSVLKFWVHLCANYYSFGTSLSFLFDV
ncbi:hypothetical protein DPMN_033646 [Dreissena polymorpha]|uniref:Uncharacterized protein n=1 Tax=Dreissena polymorpha TaxID=45954 RepID=A0A9D4M581_DREPO|nr:hypothetical protein DPMN_033646 [Dreissena polymorpha]